MYEDIPSFYPTIPFGKHKGAMIDDLPTSYLMWMKQNLTDPFLRLCAERALKGENCPEPEEAVELTITEDGRDIIINAAFELKDDIKDLPERRWDAEMKRWLVPMRYYDDILVAFPLANSSDSLYKSTRAQTEHQATMSEISA